MRVQSIEQLDFEPVQDVFPSPLDWRDEVISPPFKNCPAETSSHGYRIQNFLMVDPRWGTHEDFQELVRAAHSKNMRVVVDVVLNHTGKVWHYAGEGHPPYRSRGAYDLDHWQTTGDGSHLGADDAVWPVELQDALQMVDCADGLRWFPIGCCEAYGTGAGGNFLQCYPRVRAQYRQNQLPLVW